MQTILEAEIETDGHIRLLKPIRLRRRARVIVQIEDSTLVIDKPVDDEADRLAEERFASHFGAVSSRNPNSSDNDRIDADLAREYEATHSDR